MLLEHPFFFGIDVGKHVFLPTYCRLSWGVGFIVILFKAVRKELRHKLVRKIVVLASECLLRKRAHDAILMF